MGHAERTESVGQVAEGALAVDVAVTTENRRFSASGTIGEDAVELTGKRARFSKKWQVSGSFAGAAVLVELTAQSRLHHGGVAEGQWGQERVRLEAELARIEGRIHGSFGSNQIELFPKRRVKGVLAVAGRRGSGLDLSVGRHGPGLVGESPSHREAASLLLVLPSFWRGGAETTAWSYFLEPLHRAGS